jgi:hypothetical protein
MAASITGTGDHWLCESGAEVTIVKMGYKGVAERWKNQYFRDGAWLQYKSMDSASVHARIVAAGRSVRKIEAAIGNKSWTRIYCVQCSTYSLIGIAGPACYACGFPLHELAKCGCVATYDIPPHCRVCHNDAVRKKREKIESDKTRSASGV